MIALAPAPFSRLRETLRPLTPAKAPLDLALGEPKSGAPSLIRETLTAHGEDYDHYPPAEGAPFLLNAALHWLRRRFALPQTLLRAEENILALSGTREGLFLILSALRALAPSRRHVLIPDPAYHAYAAAAFYAGLTPLFLPALAENNFLPDWDSAPDQIFADSLAIYLCSPANPQGMAAGMGYLKNLLARARRHGVYLLMDECYSDLYLGEPCPSALQAADALAKEESLAASSALENLIVFHSLSKRSAAPGLRSGFCAGGAAAIAAFRRLRLSGGAQMPLPIQRASAALWDEESHAERQRRLYQKRFRLAEEILGDSFGFYKPDGGFFLWLEVGDGEAAAKELWRREGLRVLPGAYLTQSSHQTDPGSAFIRVALVEETSRLQDGLTRLKKCLRETPR